MLSVFLQFGPHLSSIFKYLPERIGLALCRALHRLNPSGPLARSPSPVAILRRRFIRTPQNAMPSVVDPEHCFFDFKEWPCSVLLCHLCFWGTLLFLSGD